MASIQRHGKGWRAQVAVKGIRKSRTFATRQGAKDWAAGIEVTLRGGARAAASVTLSDLLERYAAEVSPTKRGQRWEQIRLARMARESIGRHRLSDLEPRHIADWRDGRLAVVSPGTVIREMALLRAVLVQSQREWGLLGNNPMDGVKRPPAPPARDRLPTDAELQALEISAGDDMAHATARAFAAFRFAMETAMRAGEICALTWDRVDTERRTATLPRTKNGTSRAVPLSSEAIRILQSLPRSERCFALSTSQLDALWRKLRDRAGVQGLTFHDSRHAAITRLSRKLDVMALARMVGHRDIRQLLTYYNETAEDLARRLD